MLEVCDAEGINEDCVPATLGPDRDGDGAPSDGCCYLAAGAVELVCGGDCDDDDPARSPDASEICNGIDDDCDGNLDEGLPSAAFYVDADGDGYGTGEPRVLCGPDATYTAPRGGDCADDEPSVSPGEAEVCNGRDDDCDPATWGPAEDDDGDGFADADCGGDDCYDDSATAGPDVCDAIAIVAGTAHTCVLDGSGGVRCWGDNTAGQLGDGTTTTRTRPVVSMFGAASVAEIAAGGSNTCARRGSRSVYCAGANGAGQLGLGTFDATAHPIPQAVMGLVDVSEVAMGTGQVCAVAGGRARCWGSNSSGQLGDGSTTSRARPVQVAFLADGLASMSGGSGHTCAIRTGYMNAYCWGFNNYGQLGFAGADSDEPARACGGFAAVEVSTYEFHSCGRAADGRVRCWGRNLRGQLGTGDFRDRVGCTEFFEVDGVADAVRLATGSAAQHTCAVRASGELRCWGQNAFGQLGDGSVTNRNVAVATGLADVVDVAVGSDHTCALRATGQVRCWGSNDQGQLGDGTGLRRRVPGPIIP